MVKPESIARRRARYVSVVLMTIGSSIGQSALAQPSDAGGALTNFGMLRATCEEAVAEMLAGMPAGGTRQVVVIPGMAHTHNWIVGELIGARLAEGGYRVQILDEPFAAEDAAGAAESAESDADGADADSAEMLELLEGLDGSVATPQEPVEAEARVESRRPTPAGDIVEFRLGLCEVKYIDESRSFFLGSKRVQRGATVQVTCRVKDGETGDLVWVGDGEATRVDMVPKGKLPVFESDGFAPERVAGPGLMRVVEPVVVGGIVAGLVVLFYTNQN